MKNYPTFKLIGILTPFVFSFAFGLDIYIPIIPQMVQIFDTTPALIQLTLSLFLFITGFGQLFVGPLTDHFGRRKILYASVIFFTLGSLTCASSHHIYGLIFGRIVSAFGACGMLVTAFAIIRDLFSGNENAKMYSFLNGGIGISPLFAPILGGYLSLYFGWKSIFIFLALIGTFAFFINQILIQETLEVDKRTKVSRSIFKRYVQIFSHKQFLVHAVIAGLAESVLFCFFSISPFIIINLLEVPTEEFGYYFAAFGCVIAFGGIASGKMSEKIGAHFTVRLGIHLMFIGGSSMLVWYYFASLSLAGFLIPMVIACTGAMFLLGSSASKAMEPFGHIAGTASAAFGSLEFGIAALVGSILMIFPVNSTIPYAITILLIAFTAYSLFQVSPRPAKSIETV
ncbi:putative uncharacterized protein [Parachlamydia acanthamoebae UV-7]|uniref:Major facilitator superfamily (MFS) profile domain-containing protein n=2 Tax=Parachlamydia acanthamoebae TaxID=83552 RepID=F8KYH7_PARAV|nr:multidrug effflux MFS transporter [Parachlamydia acanthamoebae]EFB42342.1 hypothetical protein pah_c010o036 [Parachlamydia acanthamoebae str. Hall's coccus]CCB85925.1 putative uncharacterized protein [Parachlamydia acanthamoebae UV-7]